MDLKKHLEDNAAVAVEAVSQYSVDLSAKFAEGVEEGRGQIQLPEEGTGEKLYTQEQMSEAVSTAISNEQMASKAAIEKAEADLVAAKEEGEAKVSQLKKDVAAKIRNSSIDDLAIAEELEG